MVDCKCKKTKIQISCSSIGTEPLQCSIPCGKYLNCGKHTCQEICHDGACKPCESPSFNSCFCAKKTKVNPCAEVAKPWSCGQVCNFEYPCHDHFCKQTCHSEAHGDCIYSPKVISSCPCGKTLLSKLGRKRLKCTDPIYTCQEKCGKVLKCGHSCSIKCHEGPCPGCELSQSIRCICKKSTIVVDCLNLEFDKNGTPFVKCKRICKKKLACNRHICQQECCDRSNHDCPILCGRLLDCKSHNCMMACGHAGKCHDCIEGVSFEERSCACGATIQYPPIPCGAPPPQCSRMCTRARTCGHPNYTSHNCHSTQTPCPPCMVFTERSCACGAKVFHNIPCSRQGAPSCGLPCGKITDCGHKCSRSCHQGPCIDDTHPCIQQCDRMRSICQHRCHYQCHKETDCQDMPCKEVLNCICSCGNRKENQDCGASHNNPIRETLLPCDSSCETLKRKLALAEAFQINPEIGTSLNPVVGWPQSLVLLAMNHKELVTSTEKILEANMLLTPGQYFYFPKQKLDGMFLFTIVYNKIIQGMAQYYGFHAEILDATAKKGTVCISRIRGKSPIFPPKLLSNVLDACESGSNIADEYIAVEASEEDVDIKTKLLNVIFEPNAIFVDGISADISTKSIMKVLVPIYASLNIIGRLNWVSNERFFCTFERVESWGVLKQRDISELLESLICKFSDKLIDELGWAKQVKSCQLVSWHVKLLDETEPLISIRKRKVDEGRWLLDDSSESGWTAPAEVKQKGLVIKYEK